MSEQQFHNIVLELDFKVDNSDSLGGYARVNRDARWFPEGLLQAEIIRFLSHWRDRTQLVPKDPLESGSTYVFRTPNFFEVGHLEYVATFASEMLLYGFDDFLRQHDLQSPSDFIRYEAIVIEHLGFGCVKTRIRFYLKVAVDVVKLLGAIGGAVGAAVALDTYFDPPAPAIEASCTVHMKEPQDLGRELRRTIERYPYTWMASGNEACVRLRQQVLNQFLDSPIKDDGFYGGNTAKAEEAVARKVGLDSAEIEELYPFLTDRLEEPQSILVFNIPRQQSQQLP